MKNDLNERIHDLRERSGMTQTDLAMRLGVTRSCVNAWEMGGFTPQSGQHSVPFQNLPHYYRLSSGQRQPRLDSH